MSDTAPSTGSPRKPRLSEDDRHAVIGGAMLLVLAVLFVLGYSGDPERHSDDGYRLTAIYETADGLGPGSPVLMAGFQVGTVRKLILDKATNEAHVIMTIDDGIEIPIDSETAILSDGFAGGKYVRVLPGGDFEMLVDEDIFDYSESAIDFISLFERIVVTGEAVRGITPPEN